MLSTASFLLLVVLGLALVLFLPIWWLIPFDLLNVPLFGGWALGFLRISPSDLAIFLIGLAYLLRARTKAGTRTPIKFLLPWLLLGIMLSLSYMLAPINQRTLTGVERYVYQLFVYCWRPILYLPICFLLLRSAKRTYTALSFVILAADFCAVMAIQQGYAGASSAPGPFKTGNQLGGVLIMPTLLALVGTIFPRDRRHLIFSFVSLALFGRALLFCGSRGAQASIVVGGVVFGLILLCRHLGRRRLRYLLPFGIVFLVAIAPLIPTILSRPTVAHAVTVTQGSNANTMQWRMEERWPHFWRIALANPIFGIGTAVDPSLGPRANTPHNGFLSLLVTHGFPAFLVIVFFALRAFWNGIQLYRHAPNPDHKTFGLATSAAIAGILTHQMVEVTLTAHFTFKVFWLLVATSELARSWPDRDDTLSVDEAATVRGSVCLSKAPSCALVPRCQSPFRGKLTHYWPRRSLAQNPRLLQ